MHLNLLGGTFDPPTLGHLFISEEIVKSAGSVTWLPGGETPHKSPVATPTQRYNMISLMISGLSGHSILGLELDKPKTWTTIHTAKYLVNSGYDITWWLGSDSFQSLSSWDNYQELLTLVSFKEIARIGNISSTAVKANLANNKDMLHPAVLAYIEKSKLYD